MSKLLSSWGRPLDALEAALVRLWILLKSGVDLLAAELIRAEFLSNAFDKAFIGQLLGAARQCLIGFKRCPHVPRGEGIPL